MMISTLPVRHGNHSVCESNQNELITLRCAASGSLFTCVCERSVSFAEVEMKSLTR